MRTREELLILSLSQLGYGSRDRNARPVVAHSSAGPTLESQLLVSRKTNRSVLSSTARGGMATLYVDGRWKQWQKVAFFSDLMKILRRETKVAPRWRQVLWDVAVMAGQSQVSDDLPQAFLWNVIALEALLAEQTDKKSDVLPSRIEAFIGWAADWGLKDYERRIKEAYDKRSILVHQGDRGCITPEDLDFSDRLLFNILVNIVKHPQLFGSKKGIVEFSRRVEAERVLGLKPHVRPKTLHFFRL